MIKKKKILKRIFALVGVIAILFCMAMPLGAVEFEGISFVNYFDVSQFTRDNIAELSKSISSVDAGSSSFVITTDPYYSGEGSILTNSTFGAYCSCYEGDTLFLNMDISNGVAPNEGIVRGIYFEGVSDGYWAAGTSKTITQEMLDARFYVYGYNATVAGSVDYAVDTTILISVCINKNNRYLPYSVYNELYNYSENTYDSAFADGNSEGYQNGYNEGYEVGVRDGYDEGYVNGEQNGYEQYLEKNTIVNQSTVNVIAWYDPTFYSRLFEGYEVVNNILFDAPVVQSTFKPTVYNGYSLNSSDFDFPIVGIPDLGVFYNNTICGFLMSLTLDGTKVAGDLPLNIFDMRFSASDEYLEQPYAVRVVLEIPDGYQVPDYAQKEFGVDAEGNEYTYYSIKKIYQYTDLVRSDGVLSIDYEAEFGITMNTPITHLSVAFFAYDNDNLIGAYGMDDGRGFIIGDPNAKGFFEAGKTAGEFIGKEIGYKEGYDKGFAEGDEKGHERGYEEGRSYGYDVGYTLGYNAGKDDALQVGELTFTGLITAVIDAPVSVFASMFNFEVLGINLLNFLTSILSLMVVFAVVKVVISIV